MAANTVQVAGWNDNEEWVVAESQREYQEYEWVATYEVGDYYRDRSARNVNFYVDEETGIVTQDVAKFEKWLAGLGK